MGYILPLDQLKSILAATIDTPIYAVLAEKTREFACQLYDPFPNIIMNRGDLTPSFVRQYMDDLCSDFPLPAPPVSQFSGGQCHCITYLVDTRRIFPGGVDGGLILNTVVPGRIFGLRNVYTPGVPGVTTDKVESFIDYAACSGGSETGATASVAIGTSAGPGIDPGFHDDWFIEDITRQDGLPDDCGSIPPEYPDNTPAPNDLTFNFTLNLNDGGTQDFVIIYDPEPDGFPMKFDINGLKLEVNIVGFEFNFGGINSNGDPVGLPGDNNSVLPAPKDDKLRNFKPPVLPEPNNEDYEEDIKDETDPKEETIGEEITFIKVSITSFPNNIKNQFGDGAPNIYYCGWFEFQSDDYNFPRQPIHFINNIYFRPVGATGYAYTLYNGIEGFATTYKLKPEI